MRDAPRRARRPGGRRTLRAAAPALLALAAAAALGACDSMELAPGDLNDIYVAVDPALWDQVSDTVRPALQPTVLTVTDEKAFQVVDIDPGDSQWPRIRKFKQLLLIGTADDPWVQPAVAEREDAPAPPAVFQVRDVWSRNQVVTVLLLTDDDPSQITARLGDLKQLYDRQYREWVDARMFVSGRDSALLDTLTTEEGFGLLLPDVYQWSKRDSTYIFRNDNPSPDELIREIRVTWRSPIPGGLDELLTRGPVLEWRQALDEETLTTAQVVDTSRVVAGPMEYRGHRAFELQAIWQNPPSADWPAGGPFITRAVACEAQDRLYLIDAWLYAPGKDKYEYMIQLNTILDSFRCGSA